MLHRVASRLQSGAVSLVSLGDGTGTLVNHDELAVMSLNETGAFLVVLIARGSPDLGDLIRALVEEFDVTESQAAADACAFLEALAEVV